MKRLSVRGNLVNWWTGAVVLLSALGLATGVGAIPTMSISDGNSLVTVIDNGPGDLTTLAGAITYSGTIGVWSVIITGATQPSEGTAADPQLDVVVQATSSAAGVLYIGFSDSDFTGAGNLQQDLTGHLIAGTDASLGALVAGNTANVAGTVDANGSPVNFGAIIDNIPVQPMPLLTTAEGMLPDSAPYALTELIVLVSPEATSSSITGTLTSSVPDGAGTLTLMGLALTGLGIFGSLVKRGESWAARRALGRDATAARRRPRCPGSR